MITDILTQLIQNALKAEGISPDAVVLEHPAEIVHGDYSTNVALTQAKKAGVNPKVLAEKIVAHIEKQKPSQISKVEIAGPGFINFFLSRDFFAQSIKDIIETKDTFGSGRKNNKKVVVEYSSPNIAKPFTIGHLRSTIIGDSISNILTFLGYDVIRDNHLGDWGTQFGKMTVAFEKWGSLEELRNAEHKMKYLVDLYVRFHDEAEKNPALEDEARARFTALEQGEEKAVLVYNEMIKYSLEYFQTIYKRLNVSSFDTALGESFFGPFIPAVMAELEAKSLVEESEGAQVVFFEKNAQGKEKYPPALIKKKDGSTLYATRDLATDKYRIDTYGKDVTIVNEVGMEQSLYFKQLFEIERMLGWVVPGQRVHVAHGLYRFSDGKMSTRKGNVIWLEDILNEVIKRAEEHNADKAVAEAVGVGALKFNDLKRESSQDIVFDWDEMLNLKGDSGPYVQYVHARTCSLLNKAKEASVVAAFSNVPETIFDIERFLYRFPEVVARAGALYSPNILALYLLEIASRFNSFYAQGQIVSTDESSSSYKVAITEACKEVLRIGLTLLGIKTPEKM